MFNWIPELKKMNNVSQYFLALVLILAAPFGLHNPSQGGNDEEVTKAIQSATEAYVAAFNARDAEKLAQLWSEDATYELADTNETIMGRTAIGKMFTELFADTEPARLSVAIESIRFVTDDVAVETGTSELFESDGTKSSSRYSAIHVKRNDQWLLDSIQETHLASDEGDVNPLHELDFLVGQWVDSTDESTVETSCEWVKNKKFLSRTFRVSAPEQDDLEGTQVIGWDPIAGSIRSWVFDSDGGFSQGSWKRKGDSWIVESTGFLADGSPVSSVQVYNRVDVNSFKWQSFNRRVGDELLPAIDEITVVRKPAE